MKKWAPILVFAAGMFWGIIGIFVRKLNTYGINNMEIGLIRAAETAALMGLFILIYDRSLFKINLKDIWMFMGTGVVSVTLFNCCYFEVITMTSLSVAVILLYTSPVFIMIIAFFLFKERFTTKKVIALVLTVLGCIFITGVLKSSDKIPAMAVALGLCSGLCYGLYSIFGRFALKKYSAFTTIFYTFLFSAVATAIVASPRAIIEKASAAGSQSLIWIIGTGFVTGLIPYLLYTIGLNYMETGKAAIIVAVEPVVATLLSVFYFHEPMDFMSIIGIVMVMAAIIILNVKSKIDRLNMSVVK